MRTSEPGPVPGRKVVPAPRKVRQQARASAPQRAREQVLQQEQVPRQERALQRVQALQRVRVSIQRQAPGSAPQRVSVQRQVRVRARVSVQQQAPGSAPQRASVQRQVRILQQIRARVRAPSRGSAARSDPAIPRHRAPPAPRPRTKTASRPPPQPSGASPAPGPEQPPPPSRQPPGPPPSCRSEPPRRAAAASPAPDPVRGPEPPRGSPSPRQVPRVYLSHSEILSCSSLRVFSTSKDKYKPLSGKTIGEKIPAGFSKRRKSARKTTHLKEKYYLCAKYPERVAARREKPGRNARTSRAADASTLRRRQTLKLRYSWHYNAA